MKLTATIELAFDDLYWNRSDAESAVAEAARGLKDIARYHRGEVRAHASSPIAARDRELEDLRERYSKLMEAAKSADRAFGPNVFRPGLLDASPPKPEERRRVSLNPHEAGMVHEALWMLHGSDDRWTVPAVLRLTKRVEALADEVHDIEAPLTDGREAPRA